MLKHAINFGLFSLLTIFATPTAADQERSEAFRPDSCGYVCIYAEAASKYAERDSSARRAEARGRASINTAGR